MAQRGVNKAIIVGRLVADPEIRYMPSGGAVVNFRLATSETWNDKQTGEKKEQSEFHSVVAYGKAAEIIAEYGRKGGQMYVEGSLHTRKWQDQSGNDRYSTEIKIAQMGGVFQFLGGKSDGGQSEGNQSAAKTAWGQPQQPGGPTHSGGGKPRQQRQQPQQGGPQEPPMDFDDEIPF